MRDENEGVPRNPNKRQCDTIKADGTRCQRAAMHGKKKCYAHGKGAGPKPGNTNAKQPGHLYSKYYTEEEQAFIPNILAEINTVESEIVAATILMGRLQKLLTDHWQGNPSSGRYEDRQKIKEVVAEQADDGGKKKKTQRTHAREQTTHRTPDLWHLALQTLERLRRLKETRQTLKVERLDQLIAQYEQVIAEQTKRSEEPT